VTWTFERKLLGAAVLAWTAVAVVSLFLGPPLGHDEAAFAIVARGDEVSWLYRSRGVATLARLGLALGGADWQMRLPCMILGLALVPAVYAIGRAAFGATTGAWAAAVIAGAHPMAVRSAQLLGDVPATAFTLAGMAVIIGELDRAAGPRWRLMLAAPAFAAAFYLRYGSVVAIAIAGLAAAVIWWRAIRARPGPVLATAAALAVLLTPHLIDSMHATGSLLGVLESSAEVPRRAYWGAGVVTYLTSNPFVYYGALVAPLMAAACIGLIRRFRSRAPWFLAITALGQLLVLGIASHAQARYVFTAAALLVVLGVETVRTIGLRRAGLVAVGLAWVGLANAVVPFNLAAADARTAMTAAAAAVGRRGLIDHRSAPGCVVVAAAVPQLTWYTRCQVVPMRWAGPTTFAADRDRYIVSTPYAEVDAGALAARYGLLATPVPTGDARARVWRLTAGR
jgi:4-amino-4-deoxy-L-arabinose transferase-like glycosyltransferase